MTGKRDEKFDAPNPQHCLFPSPIQLSNRNQIDDTEAGKRDCESDNSPKQESECDIQQIYSNKQMREKCDDDCEELLRRSSRPDPVESDRIISPASSVDKSDKIRTSDTTYNNTRPELPNLPLHSTNNMAIGYHPFQSHSPFGAWTYPHLPPRPVFTSAASGGGGDVMGYVTFPVYYPTLGQEVNNSIKPSLMAAAAAFNAAIPPEPCRSSIPPLPSIPYAVAPPSAPSVIISSVESISSSPSRDNDTSRKLQRVQEDSSEKSPSRKRGKSYTNTNHYGFEVDNSGMLPFESLNRCVIRTSILPPSNWREQLNEVKSETQIPIPEFRRIINFPNNFTRHRMVEESVSGNNRYCVMCGESRPYSFPDTMRISDESDTSKVAESSCFIPRQNKGVCTACDVTVWTIVESKTDIKWCKGCKNFLPWVSFGEKVTATKCTNCRNRQKTRYAQKAHCQTPDVKR